MKKNRVFNYLKFLFTILIFMFIFYKFDFDVNTLININWCYLFLAALFRMTIMPIISMNRWQLFLKHSGIDENFFSLLKISYISAFMGIILPSSQGSDAVRMIMIEKRHKQNQNQVTASSSVIIERLIGFAILALVGLIFSIVTPHFPNKQTVVVTIFVITSTLFLLLILLTNNRCYSFTSNLISRINHFKRIIAFINKTRYSLATFPYQKVLIPSIFLILLLQLSSILIVYLVFLSFNITLPFSHHLAFYPIIAILSIIPISISGLGLREGFFVFFYSLVGVAPEVAVSVSLVNYFIQVLFAAIIGGILYGLKSFSIIKI